MELNFVLGANYGRMLTSYDDTRDNGDARVIVHSTPLEADDECWMIEGVTQGEITKYTIKKSQVCNKE